MPICAGGQARARSSARSTRTCRVLRPLGQELGVPGAAEGRWIAGDAPLGTAYVEAVQPRSGRACPGELCVDSVQRMRERVHRAPSAAEVPFQLKLGPGGIRDVEFTVQLLQLRTASRIRHPPARHARRARRARRRRDIGRGDAAAFARDYRILRVLEHRMQLLQEAPRRTSCRRDPEGRRVLARGDPSRRTPARACGSCGSRCEARGAHGIQIRLFYRPLLSAVAALPQDEWARALPGAGARSPIGHQASVFCGRPAAHRCADQRPQSQGDDPAPPHAVAMIRVVRRGRGSDYGLLAFRRISERLGDTPWFLRMLRDSSGAAESLTRVLSGSRYIGELDGVDPGVGGLAGLRRAAAAPHRPRAPGGGSSRPGQGGERRGVPGACTPPP